MFIRDFQDGQLVDQVLLIREIERRRKRDGDEFIRFQLADRTGVITAIIWEIPGSLDPIKVGIAVYITGQFNLHTRYGKQITLQSIRTATAEEYNLEFLLDGPVRSVEQLERDLNELLDTIHNSFLTELLNIIFNKESRLWQRYREVPAAKYYHQAYRHGLLEHCVTVAQAVSAAAATFPGINREVAVTGALLHDIGKVDAYNDDLHQIDLTINGRLQGEIPLGYYRVRRIIEEIDCFPPQLAQAILHIILSHHGSLENGSPVLPATREATLVHMMDNLGGRLGSFDRIEKELPDGEEWSNYDRALSTSAFFLERKAA